MYGPPGMVTAPLVQGGMSVYQENLLLGWHVSQGCMCNLGIHPSRVRMILAVPRDERKHSPPSPDAGPVL